jgi:hypothetical protein
MGEFDEKTGMDVIKDSLGMTDEDFAPQGNDSEGGEGDEFEGDDGGGDEFEGEQPRQYNSEEFEPPQQRQPQQRDQRTPTQKPDPLRQNTLKFDPRTSFRQDKKGNLVDSRTGEIIARAGSEARIYQRVHKQATDYIATAQRNIQNQVATERTKLERAVEIGLGFERQLAETRQQMQKLNAFELNQDQLVEAAQYFKQAQSDPVGVLKNLLTRAALSGIDITQLGLPAGGVDAKGIADMVKREINQAVAPIQQYTTTQQQEREHQNVQSQYLQTAERQVNSFFNSTPEAVPYMHIFQTVLQQPQFQQMSLGAIWDKVQLHLMRNGVDPRRGPSRTQRQRLSGNQVPETRPQGRSLPNGQGMAPSGSDRRVGGGAGPAHPSMSYDAIIREILASSGAR